MTFDQLVGMFRMQDQLNIKTNGEFWYFGVAENGKAIVWELAYCLERSELINWYNWKHWINDRGCKDLGQVKIEMTDMWHFVLSKILEIGYLTLINRILSTIPEYKPGSNHTDNEIKSMLKKYMENKETYESERDQMYREVAMAINMEMGVNEQKKALQAKAAAVDPNRKVNEGDFLTVLINGVIGTTNTLAYEKDKTMQTYIMQEFFLLLAMTDLVYKFGMDDLYKYYIGKIALNKFRQDNGYSSGKYVKHWIVNLDDGDFKNVEDNNILIDMLDKEDSSLLTVDSVYDKLKEAYQPTLDELKN